MLKKTISTMADKVEATRCCICGKVLDTDIKIYEDKPYCPVCFSGLTFVREYQD